LAFARPARKLDVGDGVCMGRRLTGRVIAKPDSGSVEVVFDLKGAAFDAALAAEGEMPLPPYIAGKRKADAQDAADYQTTFARLDGSVAAPTAGLHLTPELFARLRGEGIGRESVTLHVGPGTFLPVTAKDTAQHRMHAEWTELTADAAARLNTVRVGGGRITAVGTTSLRTLESAAGVDGTLTAISRETDIFITPGYHFRAVDILMTNFHLPRSTLFMLVSAFIGLEKARAVYAEAIREHYRFYSYGDACLLFRQA
ncbi:MAG: tRNA preQ1(34) S-adenosylmethionine ribosyltransferase-isomerase QueA, partial [Alphaproteobacteria bacterium]|nr:tRNA preQ1(34) S-adenosylmethionine ribosyltransferase-isomerase QueA [Alphaproteobacteria bacterium]